MKFARKKSLQKISTFCIGGHAEYFFESGSERELLKAIKVAEEKKIPWRVMGEGSNILFPDAMTKGLLIRVKGGKIERKGNLVAVSAGIPLKKLIDFSIQKGLGGLESLSGIPGTVGGAITGNAGAYGHSISECVKRVEVWERGAARWIPAQECSFSYRESGFKYRPCLILKIELKLAPAKKSELLLKSKRIVAERTRKYPKGLKCPGSFFKNPLVAGMPRSALRKIDMRNVIDGKVPAGYLLEAVGAKAMRVGAIQVADYHGNLFINTGKGTEAQVKKLTNILKERVQRTFGITLHEEVRIWE